MLFRKPLHLLHELIPLILALKLIVFFAKLINLRFQLWRLLHLIARIHVGAIGGGTSHTLDQFFQIITYFFLHKKRSSPQIFFAVHGNPETSDFHNNRQYHRTSLGSLPDEIGQIVTNGTF